MNEIVQTVAAKAGITPEQAQHAVEAVMHFVKEKLPAGLGGQIDGLLSGGGSGGLGSLLGGLTGEKK